MTAPSLTALLDTWQRWSYRDLLTRAIDSARADGDRDRADQLRRDLALEPATEPLEALAANNELTRLLQGWQWHAIRAARSAGATWDQVGTALGATAEQARADYLDAIELAERYGRGLTDTAPYRAVLDDPPTGQPLPGSTTAQPSDATGRSVTDQPAAVLAAPGGGSLVVRPASAAGRLAPAARRRSGRR